jgi:hypothetical protein
MSILTIPDRALAKGTMARQPEGLVESDKREGKWRRRGSIGFGVRTSSAQSHETRSSRCVKH